MACLRRTPFDGRIGTVSCDEKGCLLRQVSVDGGPLITEEPPEADCLLQLRLRAGDAAGPGAPEPTRPGMSFDEWEQSVREGIQPPWEPRTVYKHTKIERSDIPDPGMHREGRYPWGERSVDVPTESGRDEGELEHPVVEASKLGGVLRRGGAYPWKHGREDLGGSDRNSDESSERSVEPPRITKDDFERLIDVGTLSDWQWRWVDLIVNQGYGVERDGNYFVLIPKRK